MDVKKVLDLSCDVSETLDSIIKSYKSRLFDRKPKLKFDDELFTDLDLSTVMLELAERRAVVNIPKYERARPRCRDGRVVLDEKNRHGILTSLSSNQSTFNFSMRIIDQQVVDSKGTGYFRAFMLTDFNGDLYPGWERIDFFPVEEENEFLKESGIWSKIKTITFEHFVHPIRWISFFSEKYLISKLLIQRLEEENKFLNQELKRLQDLNVPYPKIDGEPPKSKDWPKKTIDEYDTIEVNCFQCLVEAKFIGGFQQYKEEPDSYLLIWNKRKKNRYDYLPKLRFYARCVELAYFKNAYPYDKKPIWIKEDFQDYKPPRKRITWRRLKVEEDMYLMTRVYKKKEKVPKEKKEGAK